MLLKRRALLELLNGLPHYNEQHGLDNADMGFITDIRLRVASNEEISDDECERLMKIADECNGR